MSARSTNLALLMLTFLAIFSGFAAFLVGTPSGRWVVIAHGLTGMSLLVLAPWKTMIAKRGIARHNRGRWVSIALSMGAVVTIGSGIFMTTGVAERIGPVTMMQAHVGSGLVTLALTIAHFVTRPVKPRIADLSRRNAVGSAGVLGVAGLAYVTFEGVLASTGAPGSERRFTGSHEVPTDHPVPPTQWLNDRVPRLDRESHVVDVAGQAYTVGDLDRTGDTIEATLDCTGGWHVRRYWSGTRLDHLLGDLTGESMVIRSVTGYWRRFPLAQAPQLWLATRIEGSPLPDGNGAPVRLVAPGRRGYWWVKWVETIEVDDLPAWWQPPLPLA